MLPSENPQERVDGWGNALREGGTQLKELLLTDPLAHGLFQLGGIQRENDWKRANQMLDKVIAERDVLVTVIERTLAGEDLRSILNTTRPDLTAYDLSDPDWLRCTFRRPDKSGFMFGCLKEAGHEGAHSCDE